MVFIESMLPGSVAPKFSFARYGIQKSFIVSRYQRKNGTVIYILFATTARMLFTNRQLVDIANEYKTKDIGFVAISSNDAQKYLKIDLN